jgi:2-polyprenyl-6-methoxyphenol hydroxylase-like FAD-dependent oxidoreductase
MRTETANVAIVGGGPAGIMAGLLLARQGIEVVVLEKHADFLRDFRGDTIHPATLELLDELGLIEEFLTLPHTKMERVTVRTATGPVTFADFTRSTGRYGYIAFVPQWNFLDLLVKEAERYPSFRLLMRAEVTDVVRDGDRLVGVQARTPEGTLEIQSRLVLAADGRHSTVRHAVGLEVVAESPSIDVLWFRLTRRPGDYVPFFEKGPQSVLISIDRGSYWQLAYVIPQGTFAEIKARGLPEFRALVAAAAPTLVDRLDEINGWNDVHLLSVRVDRLRRWYAPGVLFIGDAAHAMSPAGGVGINLAIQDAVAAANVLGPAFRLGGPTERDLRRVQRRRELPTRITQAFQLRMLRDLYPRPGSAANDPSTERLAEREALPFRLIRAVPALRHVVGWFIGRGVRPEHVQPPVGAR